HIVRLTPVEVISAIARRVRGGSIESADGAAAIARFRLDVANEYLVIEMIAAITGRAEALAEQRALRGSDAIQLAAALELNAQRVLAGLDTIVLVSADSELNAAALAEGLTI